MMSVYGYINCHDCRQVLFLGKALRDGDGRTFAYHRGDEADPPHWLRTQLNQIMWKFLADHTAHRIQVLLEEEMINEMFDYQDIGGDWEGCISEESYLAGWPGLNLGSKAP